MPKKHTVRLATADRTNELRDRVGVHVEGYLKTMKSALEKATDEHGADVPVPVVDVTFRIPWDKNTSSSLARLLWRTGEDFDLVLTPIQLDLPVKAEEPMQQLRDAARAPRDLLSLDEDERIREKVGSAWAGERSGT